MCQQAKFALFASLLLGLLAEPTSAAEREDVRKAIGKDALPGEPREEPGQDGASVA